MIFRQKKVEGINKKTLLKNHEDDFYIKSPMMPFVMLPEEEKEITKAFIEGYQKGFKEGELIGIAKRYTPNQIREAFGLDPVKKGENDENR